ncbi:MAG: LamG domain-containing protein [Fidelibacterota bacterium]|nr:MAG: LamG domain-containing protein [Candidatus Neomarinimicrobiota bacterium]
MDQALNFSVFIPHTTVGRRHLFLMASLLAFMACTEVKVVNSVVLSGGAYVQIANRQDPVAPLDTTSLAALNGDIFSLEIRASGDTLPQGLDAPSLFMIGDGQDGNEIAVSRSTSDSTRIYVYIGDQYIGNYSITGCDWNDPEVFTQVVITYDSTTLNIYGNGEQLGSISAAIDLNVADSDALIGADWDLSNDPSSLGNFWYGAIDEVRLWTKVLPAAEMDFRYKNPDKLTKNYSSTGLDSLLGLWRFNDREWRDGDTVPDGSGKGNPGILNEGNGRIDFTEDGA